MATTGSEQSVTRKRVHVDEEDEERRSECRMFDDIAKGFYRPDRKRCKHSSLKRSSSDTSCFFSCATPVKPVKHAEIVSEPLKPVNVDASRDGFVLLKDAVTSGAFEAHSAEYTKYSKLRGSIICVEGIISAGKTTLGKNLAKYLNEIGIKAEFYQEFVDESLLQLFYANPEKYAFAFQMFMLRSCMSNLSMAEQKAKHDGTVCVIDRSLWGNSVFASLQVEKGNISLQEWNVYLRVMKTKAPCMADYIVYLDCNPEISLERLKSRGRQSESTVPLDYLQTLERYYTSEMLLHLNNGSANIVPVQWNSFGEVKTVLDSIMEGRTYSVEGDPNLAFSRDRQFRAAIMAKLARDGTVTIKDGPM